MSTNMDREDSGEAAQEAAQNDPEVIRMQQRIDETRAHMAGTIGALETRLSPSQVREKLGEELDHVEERVRVVVREQLGEAKTLVQAELSEAKSLLRSEMNEAEERVKRGLGEARDTIKKDVKEAITGAKQAVRAATLGKVEDLATSIGDKMNDTRDTLVDTIKNNPVPAAIMGFGLAWLLMNRSKSASSAGGRRESYTGGYDRGGFSPQPGYLSRVGESVGQAGSTVSRMAHQVTDAAGRGLHQAADAAGNVAHDASESTMALAHQAGEVASQLAGQASEAASSIAVGAKRGAQRVEQGFVDALQENPMAVGAAAIALGAVVGFSLPRTDREDALMGKTRDSLLGQAESATRDAVSSASELAEKALDKAKKPARSSSADATG